MSINGWEAILRGFETALRDRLPRKLDEVNARYTDTIDLPAPRAWFRHAEETNNEWPACFIIPGEQASGEMQAGGWTTTIRPVTVAIEFDGPNAADVATALLRYEAAVLEVVLRPPYPEPAQHVQWRRTIPGDIFQAGVSAAYRSWIECTFDTKVFEEHLT